MFKEGVVILAAVLGVLVVLVIMAALVLSLLPSPSVRRLLKALQRKGLRHTGA